MRKPARIVAGVALICGVGAAAAVVLASRSEFGAFDQRTWKRPVAYCVKSPRAHMVDELIAQRLKTGMPMRSVRALLGRPDGRYPDEWVYYVTREDSVTQEGCVLLSLRTNGNTLSDARLDHNSE